MSANITVLRLQMSYDRATGTTSTSFVETTRPVTAYDYEQRPELKVKMSGPRETSDPEINLHRNIYRQACQTRAAEGQALVDAVKNQGKLKTRAHITRAGQFLLEYTQE